GPNLYAYAAGDPVNLVDPLGNGPRRLQGGGTGHLQIERYGPRIQISDKPYSREPPPEPLPEVPRGQLASEPLSIPQYPLPAGGCTAPKIASPMEKFSEAVCKLGEGTPSFLLEYYWQSRAVDALKGDYSVDNFKTDYALLGPGAANPVGAAVLILTNKDPV